MEDFFERIRNTKNPQIEEIIKEADPYAICDALENTRGGANGIYLKALEDAIIETNDIVQIYEFMFLAVDMHVLGFDRERFEEIIKNSKNPKLMCYCMEFVPGTNIEKMASELINTHNSKYMDMILKDEEYSDVLEKIKRVYPNFEELVEESKEFDYFPDSLQEYMDYKDDIEILKEQIKKTNNPHLITELANYIEYLNEYKNGNFSIEDLSEKQAELQDPMQSYEYLASVDVKDKNKLINTVINSGKVKFMYYVYEYVPGLSEKEKTTLQEEIIKLDLKGKYGANINDKKEVQK